jgi:hypothetical protein
MVKELASSLLADDERMLDDAVPRQPAAASTGSGPA